MTGYKVERQNPVTLVWVQIGTPASTAYSDSGLTPTTTYRYRVRATDAVGNLSAYSAVASATTEARESMTSLGFAEFILNDQGRLTTIRGLHFLDGKYTTPLEKKQAANRILKAMGLPQIGRSASGGFEKTGKNTTIPLTYRPPPLLLC